MTHGVSDGKGGCHKKKSDKNFSAGLLGFVLSLCYHLSNFLIINNKIETL
jgi:hypothetical protein